MMFEISILKHVHDFLHHYQIIPLDASLVSSSKLVRMMYAITHSMMIKITLQRPIDFYGKKYLDRLPQKVSSQDWRVFHILV
jgi:hypothetical protein